MIHASLPLCFAFFLGTGIPVAQEKKNAENAWFVDQNLVYERGSALSARYLKTDVLAKKPWDLWVFPYR